MGIADIVPGISGGTVAFILGIYEDLLKSISSFDLQGVKLLFSCKFRAFFDRISWQFLLPLLCGIVFSFITFAKFFTFLLNHEIYRMYLYSVFLGLILGSILYLLKKISLKTGKELLFFVVGFGIAFILTGNTINEQIHEPLYSISLSKEKQIKIDPKIQGKNIVNLKDGNLIDVPQSIAFSMYAKKLVDTNDILYDSNNAPIEYINFKVHSSFLNLNVVLCGIIAVSAMLLPGISGSYMLQILGMYGFILLAVVDLVEGLRSRNFDSDAFCIVFSMILGIAIGAIVFSRFVSYLLSHYHNMTLSCLLGFMIGALRSVWPFWTYEYVINPMRLYDGYSIKQISPIIPNVLSVEFAYSILFLFFGFFIVKIVDFLAIRKKTLSID